MFCGDKTSASRSESSLGVMLEPLPTLADKSNGNYPKPGLSVLNRCKWEAFTTLGGPQNILRGQWDDPASLHGIARGLAPSMSKIDFKSTTEKLLLPLCQR